MRKRIGLQLWITLSCVVGLSAQTGEQDADGPGRGVARISVLNGDVSVRRGDSGDLIAAAINAPLVGMDSIVTGPNSRAEVQFDYGNLLRIAGNSEVRLSELEYKRYGVQVGRGVTMYRILRDYPAEVELNTPSVTVRPLTRGLYRVTVYDDGTSEITVRAGEVDVYTPRGTQRMTAGQTMRARGSSTDPEFQMYSAIPLDDWDAWNDSRDRDLERATAYRYVSRDIYGAEDLDGHGRWVYDAQYGYVWSPTVAASWAPYRAGRWSWIDYYGWTWVSYDPWGWAPYHYGRWYHTSNYGWCWYPGGAAHHYWRPALVAFFGFGHGGVGVGFGNIGWVPLAPRDPFHAWWGPRYYGGYRNQTTIINNTTIVNNTNITNIYRNARITNAITAVDAGGFGRGRYGNVANVNASDLDRAQLVRGQVPVAPDRRSLQWNDRPATASLTPHSIDNTRFHTVRQTTMQDRVPFEQQQRGMEHLARTYNPRGAVDIPGPSVRDQNREALRGSGPVADVPRAERPSIRANGEGIRPGVGDAQGLMSRPSVRENAPAIQGEAVRPSMGNEQGTGLRTRDRALGEWRRFGEPLHNDAAGAPDNAGRRASERPSVRESQGVPSGVREGFRQEPSIGSELRQSGEPSHNDTDAVNRTRPSVRDSNPASGRENSGWSRFGESIRNGNPGGGVNRPNSDTWRNSEPAHRDVPRMEQRRESPHMPAPRVEAPRMERPSVREQSAPHVERSAPAPRAEHHGGGGGGERSGGRSEARSARGK